jgi:hypothetical protein
MATNKVKTSKQKFYVIRREINEGDATQRANSATYEASPTGFRIYAREATAQKICDDAYWRIMGSRYFVEKVTIVGKAKQ